MAEYSIALVAIGLAVIFLIATWVHIANVARVEGVLYRLGLPTIISRLSGALGAAIVVMLLLAPQIGGLLAAGYLTIITAVFAIAVKRGTEIRDCGCFPKASMVDYRFFARNGILIAAAVVVAFYGASGHVIFGAASAAIAAAVIVTAVTFRSSPAGSVTSTTPAINQGRRRFLRGVTGAATLTLIGGWAPATQALARVNSQHQGTDDATERAPRPHGDSALAMANYYGVASWFCCGNPGPYTGYCQVEGNGACGNCQSYLGQAAWPNIETGCNFLGCNYYMENLSCRDYIVIYDVCDGGRVGASISDCGPNMPLFCGETAPDCSPTGYYDRIVDLTPAAFSSVALLDQGLFSCRVEV